MPRMAPVHGLGMASEEIVFAARPKIQSQSQIFRYGQSIFCLSHRPNFSHIFDLCLHWVSVVRAFVPSYPASRAVRPFVSRYVSLPVCFLRQHYTQGSLILSLADFHCCEMHCKNSNKSFRKTSTSHKNAHVRP